MIIHDFPKKLLDFFVKLLGVRKISQETQKALLYMFATVIIMVIMAVTMIDIVLLPALIVIKRLG
jgi:hypothetical protein